jgi:hemerythrin-like metal-binding protein
MMWDSTYSVDNEVIDAQHGGFFSNRIVDLHENGSTVIYSILWDLVEFVSEQFHVEHLFMGKTDYPGFLRHSKEHDMFIEALQGFLNRNEKHDEQWVYDILNFLNDWIAFHNP